MTERRSDTNTNNAVYHPESGMWYAIGTICGRIVTSWGSSAAEAEQRLIDWTRYVIVKVED